MTQQDDITQRVLTDDEIRGEIHNAIGFGFEPGELQSVNAADLMNVAYALLSKLRAPVADERAAVDPCGYVAVKVSAVDWLKDKFPALTIKAGLCERIGGRLYTITRLMRDHDAALASAPVDKPAPEHFKPPFDNCSFRMCDLPGQCRGEGKCHHPASTPVAGEAVAWRVTHPRSPKPGWEDAAREQPPNLENVKQQDPDLVLELAYAAPQASAEQMQAALQKSFDMGKFYGSLPETDAEDVRNAALEEAARLMDQTSRSSGAELIRALKQPQADKDGCQQRAALSAPQTEQVERE